MSMNSKSESYAAAGVDITAGYKAVELMKKHIASTMRDEVLTDIKEENMVYPRQNG